MFSGTVTDVRAGKAPISSINGVNSQSGWVGKLSRVLFAAINPWLVTFISTWVSSAVISAKSITDGSIVTTGIGTTVSNVVSMVILYCYVVIMFLTST